MRVLLFAAAGVAAFACVMTAGGRARAEPAITGPFSHGNLAIYFIHGESAPGPVPLTLQEALSEGKVRVHETGSVNELKIENLGGDGIFIQSGDIVKGGRQDRVLTVSFVLPPKSGEVPIASYCVEHGRWSKRGGEDAAKFASSANAIPSRAAKLAMKAPAPSKAARPASAPSYSDYAETGQRQRAVWDEVAKTQEKLSAGVNAAVASPVSATSLELSLENARLKEARADYIAALEGKAGADDIVGFVFAVGGRINSADVYPSNGLFRKMWTKLLTASVTEALGEDAAGSSEAAAPSIEAIRAFLAGAEKGKSEAGQTGPLAKQEVRDTDAALFVEAARTDGQWVHRNYLAK